MSTSTARRSLRLKQETRDALIQQLRSQLQHSELLPAIDHSLVGGVDSLPTQAGLTRELYQLDLQLGAIRATANQLGVGLASLDQTEQQVARLAAEAQSSLAARLDCELDQLRQQVKGLDTQLLDVLAAREVQRRAMHQAVTALEQLGYTVETQDVPDGDGLSVLARRDGREARIELRPNPGPQQPADEIEVVVSVHDEETAVAAGSPEADEICKAALGDQFTIQRALEAVEGIDVGAVEVDRPATRGLRRSRATRTAAQRHSGRATRASRQ